VGSGSLRTESSFLQDRHRRRLYFSPRLDPQLTRLEIPSFQISVIPISFSTHIQSTLYKCSITWLILSFEFYLRTEIFDSFLEQLLAQLYVIFLFGLPNLNIEDLRRLKEQRMWLRKELQEICIREFGIRHQLDLLQNNAYVNLHIQKLTLLSFAPKGSPEGNWQYVAPRCNTLWFNLVGYLKLFPDIYCILDQKDFLIFKPTVLHRGNFNNILTQRIQSCKDFIDICRIISCRGTITELISRSEKNKILFYHLSEQSRYTDPEGKKLIPLNNRIRFIRNWVEKVVLLNQHTLKILIPVPLPIFPQIDTITSKLKHVSPDNPKKATYDAFPIPLISATKTDFQFSRLRKRPKRLSDICTNSDSDSCSSSDSLWHQPFAK